MSKTFKIVGNDMSDGYHTFDELYEHRCLLFINLCRLMPDKCRWKIDYVDWFCLYCELPSGQISYHIPNKYLSLIADVIAGDTCYVWDGHTPSDVTNRLIANCKG